MYKLFTLSLAALCFSFYASANVFRVNNNLATDVSQKIYASIQEANDAPAIAAGDTLMIEGSPAEYESVDITKRLVIIGPGYLLTENPQTQAYPGKAVVKVISLNDGANGSVLMGLTFSNGQTNFVPYIKVSNVVVMRCYIPHPIEEIGSISNVQIIQNYFLLSALQVGQTNYTFTGFTLKNNFIGADINIPSNNTTQRVFSAIENNIFLGSVTATTTTFRSNILVTSSATATVASGSIQNNLVSNGQLPATNGNQTYVAANLFVGAAGNSTDGKYKIKPASPYITAGYNGTQPGIFGGSQPYVLSGIPPIPSIYEFTADGFANKNNGLLINIKVKANQ